jgi:hypothetical protein
MYGRTKNCALKLGLCCLVASCVTSEVSAADGWKAAGDITFVQPEVYRSNNESGLSIVIGTTIPVSDCNGSNLWAIKSDNDPSNRLYAAALAAFTTGKKVELYQWSCMLLGGTYYGRIGSIKVLP